MSLVQLNCEIEYPESDGMPTGETDIHRNWMIRICDLLKHRFRGQDVYVGCDLLLYYEKDIPQHFVVPDDFVVLGSDPSPRQVYKLWEEGKPPNVVFEVTSKSTRKEDTVVKFNKYAMMGVREYYLYDPTGEYLSPALQGYRLSDDSYLCIEPDDSNAFECKELGLLLRLARDQLVMCDRRTGEQLLTEAEASAQRAEAAAQRAEVAERRATAESQRANDAAQRAEQERAAREEAERKIQELEATLKRLTDQAGGD